MAKWIPWKPIALAAVSRGNKLSVAAISEKSKRMEITPRPAAGLGDEELLRRVRCNQTEAQVALVAKELVEARQLVVP